jgi:hypothetical protein
VAFWVILVDQKVPKCYTVFTVTKQERNMSYIVYQVGSTAKIKEFNTAAGAKRSATVMNRNAGAVKYAVAHFTYYDTFVVHKKTVRNLMTGQAVEIDSNTPWCCNPASETYWSM